MPRRPNILLIVTDQQRPDLVGALGRVPVQTPFLDRLCREGTAFTRTYTPCPLCTPARASIVSGQYPSRHGAWSIGVDAPSDMLSLPALLRAQAGYFTAHIGKSHLQACLVPGSPEALPRSRDWDFLRQWRGPHYGYERALLHVGHGNEPHAYALHYGLFLHEHGIPPERPWFARPGEPGVVWESGRWALPESLHSSTWVADRTIDTLAEQRGQPDRPFFVAAHFPDPHQPFIVPEPWDTMHDDVALPPPVRAAHEPDTNATTLYRATVERRDHQLGWHDHAGLPCQISYGSRPNLARDAEEERRWRHYLGMQSLVDKNVGRILAALEENDQAADTLVIYTSDHGDMMGDHWLWSKGGNHYDAAVRVPFLARWPGRIPAGVRSESLLNLVDLAPTFLAAAGLSAHPAMQGVDQTPTLTRPDRPSRTGTMIEHRVERGLTVRSWITARHRLSVHSILAEERDELELYDFASDPDELVNLAHDPAARETLIELLTALHRHRETVAGPWAQRPAFA